MVTAPEMGFYQKIYNFYPIIMKQGENVHPMGRYYCLNISLIGLKLRIFIIECVNYLHAPGTRFMDVP